MTFIHQECKHGEHREREAGEGQRLPARVRALQTTVEERDEGQGCEQGPPEIEPDCPTLSSRKAPESQGHGEDSDRNGDEEDR